MLMKEETQITIIKQKSWQHQQYPSCCSSILEHSYSFPSPSLKHFIMLIIIMTILILELILLPVQWSPLRIVFLQPFLFLKLGKYNYIQNNF